MGVRSSWLMLARNSDLARLACSSRSFSRAQLRRRLLLLGDQALELLAHLVHSPARSPNSSRFGTVMVLPRRRR